MIVISATTGIGHTDPREVEMAEGRNNRAVRGYYNRRLPDGK